MVRFTLSRVLQGLLSLIVVLFLVFALSRLLGDPVNLLLPLDASPADRAALHARLGLDQPLLVQYWIYLTDIARGDFGTSLRTHTPVVDLLVSRLWNSFRLATVSLGVMVVLAVPLGVLAAAKRGRIWDRIAVSVAVFGQAVPVFWAGTMAVLVFAVLLRWFPTGGMGTWKHYVLPALTISSAGAAGVIRLLRSSLLESLDSEYVKFARTKGLSDRKVLWKHSLRNALIPVVTWLGFSYGILLTAGIVVEVVFSWPGLGLLMFQAVGWRDFPIIQAAVLLFATLLIAINLVIDVLYAVLDPRVRL